MLNRPDLSRRLDRAVSAYDAGAIGMSAAADAFRVPFDLVSEAIDRAYREGRITRKPHHRRTR